MKKQNTGFAVNGQSIKIQIPDRNRSAERVERMERVERCFI
jgi:hypothetical protein